MSDEKQDVDQLSDDDINAMGVEDLDSVEIDGTTQSENKETNAVDDDSEVSDENASDETAENETDETDLEETDDDGTETQTDAETDDDGNEEEKPDEEEITHDPLTDTKRALTKAQQEAAELRKKLQEKDKAELEAKKAALDFSKDDVLDENELTQLFNEDPEAYRAYMDNYTRWLKEETDITQKESELKKREIQDYQKQVYTETAKSVSAFAQSVLKIDPKDSQALNKYLDSQEFVDLCNYINEPENEFESKDGVFSARQLKRAWTEMNEETIKKQAAVDARKETVQSIAKAKKGGSRFDRLSKTNASERAKKLKELPQDEIDKMGLDELEQYNEGFGD